MLTFLSLLLWAIWLCEQVPGKTNYSLVMYFVADKPIQPGSLLDQFANGDDAFRNSRFKLIPSIVEVWVDSLVELLMLHTTIVSHWYDQLSYPGWYDYILLRSRVNLCCDSITQSLSSNVSFIFQGYWMVKRAVGTKACLLGKAVTINYLRKDNFLEVLQSTALQLPSTNLLGPSFQISTCSWFRRTSALNH